MLKKNSQPPVEQRSGFINHSPSAPVDSGFDRLWNYEANQHSRHSVALMMEQNALSMSIQDLLEHRRLHVVYFKNIIEYTKWVEFNDFEIVIIKIESANDPLLLWISGSPEIKSKKIIVLAEKNDASIKLASLEAGADYYISTPLIKDELLIVINNFIRKSSVNKRLKWKLFVNQWILTTPTNQCIKLTYSEKMIIDALGQHPGQLVSKDTLAIALGHSPSTYDFRRLEIIIRRLRKKIYEQAGIKIPLETAHRRGYSFTADCEICKNEF